MNDIKEELERVSLNFEKSKALKPESIPFSFQQSATVLLSIDWQRKQFEENAAKSGEFQLGRTFCGDEKHSCLRPLSDLQMVDLTNLQSNKVHHGKYILVRVSTKPFSQVGISFGVTAPSGASILCVVYHYPILPITIGNPTLEDLDVEFPLGKIIAIKEPFVKNSLQEQAAFPFIRVDSPTDIENLNWRQIQNVRWAESLLHFPEWFPPVDPALSILEWKERGNAAMKASRYYVAYKLYGKGIEQHCGDPQTMILYLNRSAAGLKLERFVSSLEDAMKAISFSNANTGPRLLEKAFLRKATSVYAMRQWKAAEETFLELNERFPQSKEADEGLKSVAKRLIESKTGVYDLNELIMREERGSFRMDVADFFGPIKVDKSVLVSGQRCVFATRDVKAGELVMAVKAYGASYSTDDSKKVFSMNLLNKRVESTTQYALITEVAYRMLYQPCDILKGLYDGKKAILGPYSFEPKIGGQCEGIDIGSVEGIAVVNSFGSEPSTGTGKDFDSPSLLFAQSSMFNHSCEYNCYWTCIGDVQFIRAIADIPKGAEMTISYVGHPPYLERQKKLRNLFWNQSFDCSCTLCESEKMAGQEKLEARVKLLNSVEKLPKCTENSSVQSVKQSLKTLELFVVKLKATYTDDAKQTLKPDLALVYNRLSFHQGLLSAATNDKQLLRKAKESSQFVLKYLGIVVDNSKEIPCRTLPKAFSDLAVKTAIQVANLASSESEHQKWLKAVYWLDHNCTGCGKKHFERKYHVSVQ